MPHRDRSQRANRCACGQPAPGATLCKDCTRRLTKVIAETPGRASDLALTMARLDNTTNKVDGGRSNDRPLPLNLDAADCLASFREFITRWTRRLVTEERLVVPANSYNAVCVAIITRMADIRRRTDAQQLLDQLTELHERAAWIIDQPQIRSEHVVGPCPNDLPTNPDTAEVAHCPGRVSAVIPAREDQAAFLECSACNQQWSTIEWNRTCRRIHQRAEATTQAATAQLEHQRHMLGAKYVDTSTRPVIVDCPSCKAKRVTRRRRTCPYCLAVLLHIGEVPPAVQPFIDDGLPYPPVYLWRAGQWHLQPSPARGRIRA